MCTRRELYVCMYWVTSICRPGTLARCQKIAPITCTESSEWSYNLQLADDDPSDMRVHLCILWMRHAACHMPGSNCIGTEILTPYVPRYIHTYSACQSKTPCSRCLYSVRYPYLGHVSCYMRLIDCEGYVLQRVSAIVSIFDGT